MVTQAWRPRPLFSAPQPRERVRSFEEAVGEEWREVWWGWGEREERGERGEREEREERMKRYGREDGERKEEERRQTSNYTTAQHAVSKQFRRTLERPPLLCLLSRPTNLRVRELLPMSQRRFRQPP